MAQCVKRAHIEYDDFKWSTLDGGMPTESENAKKIAAVLVNEPYRIFSNPAPSDPFPIG